MANTTKKEVKAPEQTIVVVNVVYYETATAKKKKNPLGFFRVPTPLNTEALEKIKPVNETLTGEKLEADQKRYKGAVDNVYRDCQFAALDYIRDIVGVNGVLEATKIETEGGDD